MNVAQINASAMLAASGNQLNGGTLLFYSGTQPASPETALSGNTLLCTFTFANPAFGTPTFSGGLEQDVANFVANSVAPVAAGTVTFARALGSGGAVIDDFTVGTTGTDVIIGNANIQMGVNVSLTSFSERMPAV